MVYYRVLNRVPCAIQYNSSLLFIHSIHTSLQVKISFEVFSKFYFSAEQASMCDLLEK